MRFKSIPALGVVALAAGCAGPEERPGDVVAYNGNMVIIEGALNRPDGKEVGPTAVMVANAEDVCGRPVRFVSWDDEAYGGGRFKSSNVDTAMATYRFVCR